MTVRAVILGVLGAAFIAAATYLNDGLLRNTHLVGNHFPIGVFGPLIVVVLAVNPLLRLLGPRWRLRAGELAVVTALMLGACSIPGSGLMRTFTNTLLMPISYDRLRPEWQQDRILSYVPESLIPNDGRYDTELVDGFINGLPRPPNRAIGLGDVPWGPWRTPLATWGALLLLAGLSVICLAMIVHRQWAVREHLRYPVADFATTLMGIPPPGDDRPVYRRRIFWIALGLVLSIRVVNGLQVYYPGSIRIPLVFDFRAILETWPSLWHLQGVGYVTVVRVYPTALAIGFLLASQVSFSLGVAPLLLLAASAVMLSAGVDTGGGYFTGGVLHWQRFGSYLALGLMVVYIGRRYYGQVLKKALTFLPAPEAEASAVWSCRLLILSVAGMVVILASVGLDWPLALLMVLLLLLMFMGLARINAESGLFYLQPYWQPMMVFIGLFSLETLGPRVVAILAMLSAVFAIDPRECLMPFTVNALRMCDRLGVRPGRAALASAGVFALALAVAIPVALWANYNYGLFRDDVWATESVPDMTYEVVARTLWGMSDQEVAQVDTMTTWQRLAAARPNRRFLIAAGVGLLLVLVFSVLRLRWAKFPLHPIMFLVWGTYPLGLFCHSFMLGWLVKAIVLKYGGGREVYHKAARFMYGVIAGDLLGGLSFMVFGALYYAATGDQPLQYMIFPS